MDSIGLSTSEALQKLQAVIQDELHNYNQQQHKNLFSYLKDDLCQNNSICINGYMLFAIMIELILLVLNLSFQESRSQGEWIAELIIVAIIIIVNILICWRESYLKKTEVYRLIADLSNCIYDENLSKFIYQYPTLTPAPNQSISLIWTYRDCQVVNVPTNLLVEGDVIIIAPGEKAPSHCRQLPSSKSKQLVTLLEGEIYNPDFSIINGQAVPQPRSKFEVLHCPFRNAVRSYLKENITKRKSFTEENVLLINQVISKYAIWVVLVCSMAVGLLRWIFLRDDVSILVEMICLIPAHVLLPMLPLTFPLIWYLVSFYGSSRLRTLFDQLQEDGNKCHEVILPPDADCNTCMRHMWNILKGDPYGIPRTVDMLHTFGNITTFCCVDKTGILCNPIPIPEKVFVFNNKKKIKEVATELSFAESMISKEISFEYSEQKIIDDENEIESSVNDFNIFSISHDPQSEYEAQFDDTFWEQWNSSLRPIAINILLNSSCSYPMKTLRNEDFTAHLQLFNNEFPAAQQHSSCLCKFAGLIGFSCDQTNDFFIDKQIFTYQQKDNSVDPGSSFNYFLSIVKEKRMSHIISTIAYDKFQGVEQMFSQGTGDLILEACTDLWNGEELCELKESERKSALNFFQRMNITGQCIAFSYRPIFENDASQKDVYISFPSKEKKKNYSKDEEISIRRMKNEKQPRKIYRNQKDIVIEDMLDQPQIKHNDASIQCQEKNQCRQIFLGMITLTEVLKKDVVTMIEQLDNAGIRFVHFSYDNELLSRVFCQRLGLETGWNCHISLGDSGNSGTLDDWSTSAVSDSCHLLIDEENDPLTRSMSRSNTDHHTSISHKDDDEHSNTMNYNELYFMSNRSKLPRGIQHMRSHLEEVDDVPLLVPLFTDCNPSAVSEMMQIMQEYDELTCCIGSSLNQDNYDIFSCSDISICLQPDIEAHCAMKREHKDDQSSQTNQQKFLDKGPLHLSSILNSVTCSLFAKRTDSLPVSAIFCEARRLSIGSRMCFQFLFSAHLMVSLIVFLASIFQLPPPLSGLQIIWLICVVMPLMSLSLIGTPGEKALMEMITGKRKKIKSLKESIMPLLKQFLFTFGVNALFIVLVMLPWLQYTTCNEMTYDFDCHWLLGARNVSSSWNGWFNEYFAGYHMVQDIMLFYITCTIIVLSIRFVYPQKLLWQTLPFNNKPWVVCLILCLLLQLIYTLCSFYRWSDPRDEIGVDLTIYSPIFYCISLLWICALIGFGDVVKRTTIREFIRFQKRERLKFNTKLGMNSPV